ncbi:MAG: outer membrane beta-barrel protein [Gemmatimonadota bacterium]|nr:outer membrane beta-barrel protein [Gemmatimonadota bacterium]
MKRVKRIACTAAFTMAAVAGPASGQLSVTPTVGWATGGSVDGFNAEYSLGSDITYGGILGFGVARGGHLELVFDWNSTDVEERPNGPGTSEIIGDVDIWSLQAGGTYEFVGSDNVAPFLAGGLGITVFNPGEDLGSDTETRFSLHAGLGADLARWIKIGGRMWIPFIDTSGGFWCGPGGCGVGAGGEVLVRWEVYGGINIGSRRR